MGIRLFMLLVVLFFYGCKEKSEKEKIADLGWGEYNVEISESRAKNSIDSTYFFRTKKRWKGSDGTSAYYEFTVVVKQFESEELARDFYSNLLFDTNYMYVCLFVKTIYLYADQSGHSRNENLRRIDEFREMIHGCGVITGNIYIQQTVNKCLENS